jgi:hypothetical protein
MKHTYALVILLFCALPFALHAQDPQTTIRISVTDPDPEEPQSTQSTTLTRVKLEGSPYDTAVFDSTVKVPFKIYEWRGEEMIHNWVSLGCPRAPHIYLGAGFYRFDKFGMSDVQIGFYPSPVPKVYETYFAASQMIFLKKKSKEVDLAICIAHSYSGANLEHLEYVQKFRRDKFYGITAGIAYEGIPNLKNKTMYIYKDVQSGSGESRDVILRKYNQVNVNIGLSSMRCQNVEYEAPLRKRKGGRLHASTMSRLTIGGSYYPVINMDIQIDSGYVVDMMERAAQPDFSAFISWEGRVAFLNMRRECGLHMNLVFTYPTWNRVNDMPLSFVNTWGFYFSLDKRNPRWQQKLNAVPLN